MILMAVTSLFMILLVLIQRGRGGGLVGALGGTGGHSAFGSKAGDKIIWFTVYLAAAWIALAILAVKVAGCQRSAFSAGRGIGENAPTATDKDAASDGAAPASGSGADSSTTAPTDGDKAEQDASGKESTGPETTGKSAASAQVDKAQSSTDEDAKAASVGEDPPADGVPAKADSGPQAEAQPDATTPSGKAKVEDAGANGAASEVPGG